MDNPSKIKSEQNQIPLFAELIKVLRETGWYILGGLAGSILLLYLFADLTEDVFSREFTSLDDNFELWIHSFASSALTGFFDFFTTIGGIAGISILTVLTFGLLWWQHHLRSAWLLALAVGGGVLINQILKQLFQRPRPELWAITGPQPTTFSFPSGHATVSLCYFAMLAWLGFRFIKPTLARWLWAALMVLFILLVGLSRIYFGVHYPTDVIAGYLSGGFWMVILLNGAAIFNRLRKGAQDLKDQ